MGEMTSNADSRFGAGFSTGRGFLPRVSRDPSFRHRGPPDFYGPPPPPSGNYRDNYQGSRQGRDYYGPPPRSYYDSPVPGPMRGHPPFHHIGDPRDMDYPSPSGYNGHHSMYGSSFEPDFFPRRRRGRGRPSMPRLKEPKYMYFKQPRTTWSRNQEPPKNEWERKENWWNDAIRQAVRAKMIARKKWKMTRSDEDWKTYIAKKKDAKRKVNQAKARTLQAMGGEPKPRRTKKNPSESNDQGDAEGNNSQAEISEEMLATEDQNISSSSEDEDVSQEKTTEDVLPEEGLEGISNLSEYQDNVTDDASQGEEV